MEIGRYRDTPFFERDATGERSNLPCQDVRCITTAHILPSVSPKNSSPVKLGTDKGQSRYSHGNDGSPKVRSKCGIGLVRDCSDTNKMTAV